MRFVFLFFSFMSYGEQSHQAQIFSQNLSTLGFDSIPNFIPPAEGTVLFAMDLKTLAQLQKTADNPHAAISLNTDTAQELLRHFSLNGHCIMGDRLCLAIGIKDHYLLQKCDQASQAAWDLIDNYLVANEISALKIIYPSLVASLISIFPKLKNRILRIKLQDNQRDLSQAAIDLKLSRWAITKIHILRENKIGIESQINNSGARINLNMVAASLLSLGIYLKTSPNLSPSCLRLLAAR